jgi:hypothetical protein
MYIISTMIMLLDWGTPPPPPKKKPTSFLLDRQKIVLPLSSGHFSDYYWMSSTVTIGLCYWVTHFQVKVFNTTFNNISVISWQSVLVEKTGVPRENNRSVASHWQIWETFSVIITFQQSYYRLLSAVVHTKWSYLF